MKNSRIKSRNWQACFVATGWVLLAGLAPRCEAQEPQSLDTALQRAIAGDGHLGNLLSDVPERVIRTPETAAKLIELLDIIPLEQALRTEDGVSQLDVIIALFQNAHNGQAIALLRREGLPYLYRYCDQMSEGVPEEAEDEYLYLLQLFAGYQTRDGTQRVVQAAKRGLLSEHPLWPFVFDAFTAENADTLRVMRELSQPLPKGEIAIGVLDCANALSMEGVEFKHPFDQDSGVQLISKWLDEKDESGINRAQSGTAAIPFLQHSKRNRLLQKAVDHSHPLIRAEAGWALVKLGDRRGLRLMQIVARDVRYSNTAKMYLEELGETNAIPPEARDPDFIARSTMCQYLRHPAEMGSPPDEVEVMDSRVLKWPPSNDQRRLWLVRFRYNEVDGGGSKEGVGIVGSRPNFIDGSANPDMTISDLYGLYCAWELKANNDARSESEPTIAGGLKLLREANPDWD